MRCRKGVTLVELLIVVLILAGLAALAIPRIAITSTTAKENACKTNVNIIQSQVELYMAINDTITPPTLATLFADTDYFPQGEPNCPVDTTKGYQITSGTVDCKNCADW